MGRDVRHQVLRGALSVKVHGKLAMIAVRDLFAPWCVKVYVKSQISRVGAYPHTLKSGLRPPAGASIPPYQNFGHPYHTLTPTRIRNPGVPVEGQVSFSN